MRVLIVGMGGVVAEFRNWPETSLARAFAHGLLLVSGSLAPEVAFAGPDES